MQSTTSLWNRTRDLSENNTTSDGRAINVDLWFCLDLIIRQLRAIDVNIELLSQDSSSLSYSMAISLLDKSMEELDEKLQILEAEVENQQIPM